MSIDAATIVPIQLEAVKPAEAAQSLFILRALADMLRRLAAFTAPREAFLASLEDD